MKTMRQWVLITGLMMCGWAVSAQLLVTPEVGMSATHATGYEGWSAGLKAGAALEYRPRSGVFSLQSGAYYMQRAYNGLTMMNVDFTSKSVYLTSAQSNNHYLQIPLLAKFRWKITDRVRMHIALGPYVGISLKNTGTVKGSQINFDPLSEGGVYFPYNNTNYGYYGDNGYGSYGQEGYGKVSVPYSKSDNEWGAAAVIGVDIDRLSIRMGYETAFGDTNRRSVDLALQTFNLTIGYSFQLTK